MKTIGTLILAICPIIYAISHSIKLKLNKNQIEKIIQLINYFINEIKFYQNNLQTIVDDCCKQTNFNSLTFLKTVKTKMKQKPFPLAWEDAIDEWQCSIGSDEKNLLKSLSQTLGAFDKDGQINSLKHVKTRFEESFQAAKSVFEKKSKPTKSLGILLSLAIYIILI